MERESRPIERQWPVGLNLISVAVQLSGVRCSRKGNLPQDFFVGTTQLNMIAPISEETGQRFVVTSQVDDECLFTLNRQSPMTIIIIISMHCHRFSGMAFIVRRNVEFALRRSRWTNFHLNFITTVCSDVQMTSTFGRLQALSLKRIEFLARMTPMRLPAT